VVEADREEGRKLVDPRRGYDVLSAMARLPSSEGIRKMWTPRQLKFERRLHSLGPLASRPARSILINVEPRLVLLVEPE